jgi:DNA-binding LytR/AlgR family response regulator
VVSKNKPLHIDVPVSGNNTIVVKNNLQLRESADNKILFLIDKEGNRFVIHTPMEKLETALNPKHFFRLNEKIIINATAIER